MESATELSDTKPDIVDRANVDKNEETKEKKPFNIKNFIITIVTSITVEPYLVIYFCSIVITSTAVQNLYLEKACRADLKYPDDVCLKVIAGTRDNNYTIEVMKKSSIEVANLIAWKDPLQTGIPAIFILFIGAWSDKTGNRKAILLLPLVGEICGLVGTMFATFFLLEWRLWVLGLIEVLCTTFTGGFAVGLMGCYSYLADVTTEESRTFRMGIFIVLVKASTFVALPIAGFLAKVSGYYGIFGTALATHVVNLIYTTVRIRNVKNTAIEGNFMSKVVQFFHPRNIWETVSILFTSSRSKVAQIILVILAHLIISGPVAGEGSVTRLYLLNRFGMDILAFSLYNTFSSIISVVGVVIAVTVFSKWLKFHDSLIGIIATASNVLSSIIYGLAKDKYYFFGGTAVDVFGNAAGAAIRSLGTKIVEQDQVGKICSLIGLVDSLMPSIYLPIFNKMLVYSLTTTLPGAVYLLGAVLTSPDFILFAILYLISRRRQRNEVKHPEIKEMHVYDNDVTSL